MSSKSPQSDLPFNLYSPITRTRLSHHQISLTLEDLFLPEYGLTRAITMVYLPPKLRHKRLWSSFVENVIAPQLNTAPFAVTCVINPRLEPPLLRIGMKPHVLHSVEHGTVLNYTWPLLTERGDSDAR